MAKSTSKVKKWWTSLTIIEKNRLTDIYFPKKNYTRLTGENIREIYLQEK